MKFGDRVDAGHRLAEKLEVYRDREDVVVATLPRGGLPVGLAIAGDLGLALVAVHVQRIAHPRRSRLTLGAVSALDHTIDHDLVREQAISREDLDARIRWARAALAERSRLYRASFDPSGIVGRTVLLTDDGVQSGQTLRTAVALLRRGDPDRIEVVVPVGSPRGVLGLQRVADSVLCILQPPYLGWIGDVYRSFEEVEDGEAIRLLDEADLSTTR